MNHIHIVEWDEKNHSSFINLSIEWLEKYVSVEEADLKMLNDPQGQILDNGGTIFFAISESEAVGTAAMIKLDDTTFELAKLAVKEEFKGRKIGNQLMDACIHYAKAHSANKIILFTNHKLVPAIHLYEKYGFHQVLLANNKYIEADIKMELILTQQ
ncbi:GNAT family N-acetyltransferase [Paenibacillus sp. NPDC058174]|uniref:GNAT family N-acetyltransferase n=1 Tax=Paenibacillus sp. NPDC058174 TaxID=3346366 RepID=UPI0036DB786B